MEFTGGEYWHRRLSRKSLVERFSVQPQRDLQFDHRALFWQAEAQAFQRADVAFFPFTDVKRFTGFIRRRPGDGIGLLQNGFGIDVVDFLLAEVDKQVAVPDAE